MARPKNSSETLFAYFCCNSGWRMVSKGSLCRVDDAGEGRRVLDTFQDPSQDGNALR